MGWVLGTYCAVGEIAETLSGDSGEQSCHGESESKLHVEGEPYVVISIVGESRSEVGEVVKKVGEVKK